MEYTGCCGRHSSIGIATRYGPDSLEIESRWGDKFSATVHNFPGAHPASCTMGTGSFPGVKRPGRGVDYPPPYRAEVKERVELYLHLLYFLGCYRVSYIYLALCRIFLTCAVIYWIRDMWSKEDRTLFLILCFRASQYKSNETPT